MGVTLFWDFGLLQWIGSDNSFGFSCIIRDCSRWSLSVLSVSSCSPLREEVELTIYIAFTSYISQIFDISRWHGIGCIPGTTEKCSLDEVLILLHLPNLYLHDRVRITGMMELCILHTYVCKCNELGFAGLVMCQCLPDT